MQTVSIKSTPMHYLVEIDRTTLDQGPAVLEENDSTGDLGASSIADTGFEISEDHLARLEVASTTGDEEQFIEACHTVNWALEPAQSYAGGVRMALAAGAHAIARKLASEGAQRFPDHRELQKMAHILAAPTVRRVSGAADPGLLANRDWLRSHREEYKGGWVALRAGQLLGMAETADQLVEQVGEITNQKILITQVY